MPTMKKRMKAGPKGKVKGVSDKKAKDLIKKAKKSMGKEIREKDTLDKMKPRLKEPRKTYMKKMAKGGMTKKKGYAKGGMKKKGYAAGGALEKPKPNQTGLNKLPTSVRNKMGYMSKGGMMKKKGYAKGGMKKKGYSRGGVISKKATRDYIKRSN